MTLPRYRPFDQIVEHTKARDRHKENSGRLAHSMGTFKTTGWGEFSPEDAVEFASPYLYRPSVAHGWSLETDDDEAQVRVTRYPRCDGGVTMWIRDNNGFYMGAFVAITVEDRSPFIAPTVPDANPTYNILHDFVFLGIALKDLPSPIRGHVKDV